MHLERFHKVAQLRAGGHDDALERALVDLLRRGLDAERAERTSRGREGGHERGRAEAVVEGVLYRDRDALDRASGHDRGCYSYRTVEAPQIGDDSGWEGGRGETDELRSPSSPGS